MPTLGAMRFNPDLKIKYAVLREGGKLAKVTINTLMRKLVARLLFQCRIERPPSLSLCLKKSCLDQLCETQTNSWPRNLCDFERFSRADTPFPRNKFKDRDTFFRESIEARRLKL